MKKFFISIFILAFLITSKGFTQSYFDFTLPDLDGNDVILSKLLEDGPVLISFWATWCAPCKEEMKEMNKIYDKYKDQGFTYLAINTDSQKSLSKVKPYISANRYTFPVVLDTELRIFEAYSGQGAIPYSVLISNEGEVVATHTGFLKGDELKIESEILSVLKSEATNLIPDTDR